MTMVHLVETSHQHPRHTFKPAYFEAFDLITNSVPEWFDQPGYQIYWSLETLLIKVSKRNSCRKTWIRFVSFTVMTRTGSSSFPAANIWNSIPNGGGTSNTNNNHWFEATLSVTFSWTSFSSFSSQTTPVVDTSDASNYTCTCNATSEGSLSVLHCLKELPADNNGSRTASSLDDYAYTQGEDWKIRYKNQF